MDTVRFSNVSTIHINSGLNKYPTTTSTEVLIDNKRSLVRLQLMDISATVNHDHL